MSLRLSLTLLACLVSVTPVTTVSQEPQVPALNISVALLNKGFRDELYTDYITLTLVISNLSPRGVRALSGVVTFMELSDRPILLMCLAIEALIEQDQPAEWSGDFAYNRFFPEHVRLREIDVTDVRAVFALGAVTYIDGTRERFPSTEALSCARPRESIFSQIPNIRTLDPKTTPPLLRWDWIYA